MACTVATSPSPAASISPARSPLSCKPEALSSLLSPSRRALPSSPSPLALRALALPASYSSSAGVRSASSIKRKRALWIEVPEATACAAAPPPGFLEDQEEMEKADEGFAVYCRRGKRRLVMEDRFTADFGVAAGENMAFFGVFDGHGGKRAAEFASLKMGPFIMEEMQNIGDCHRDAEEAVRAGYLRTDKEFLKEEVDGGTCCATALLRKGSLVVSNVGDCRAVLCRAGKAEVLTLDHRLSSAMERDRVERLGAFVDCCRGGVWRLQGTLAVSRGIGDAYLKQWVSAEPETKTLEIEPECEFLILASDGLWDKLGNQEAVDIARPLLCNKNSATPLMACRRLVDLSIARGSTDDTSVLIVDVQHFG